MNTLSKMGMNFSLGDGKELHKTDVTDPTDGFGPFGSSSLNHPAILFQNPMYTHRDHLYRAMYQLSLYCPCDVKKIRDSY